MTYTLYKSQIRTLKQSDPKVVIYDGLMQAPRAGFEINQSCPKEYKIIINECILKGWLKPVANVTERELVFMGLSKND
jgi:hypothetical protein